MRESLFPMTTSQAANHLRSGGYDCKPQMLELLVGNGVVRPSQPDACTQGHVDLADDYLKDAELFSPYDAMCQSLGWGYANFLWAQREAAERESPKYGHPIPADDQYFVMHRCRQR